MIPRRPTTTHDDSPAGLTGGGLLARNAVGNLLTQCAPMAAAVFTVPILIARMGTDRFGMLTLAWMVLGYFSLFDLGLGRALTKMVAETLGLGRPAEVPTLVGTALGLMTLLGVAGGVFVAALAPTLVHDLLKVPDALRGEALGAFRLMAIALPFVIGTAGLRGVMEAHQRFGAINIVRTCVGLFSYLGPLAVLPFSRSLVPVVAVIFAGRMVSWLIHVVLCVRIVRAPIREFTPRAALVRPLIGFGGWMTLTNIINPLMVQMDRFLVAALISTAAVAYYTTPYELVTKCWFLSNAILGVMFPAFATSFVQDRHRTSFIFGRTVKYIFLILFPPLLVGVALAQEGMTLWLGAEFARQGTRVLQILALGVFLNGLAQVPSALTQAIGRPDLTFKLHLIELPVYLVTAWFLIEARGIEGAAIAWTARTALDLLLFFGAARWILPDGPAIVRRLASALAAVLPAMGLCALPLVLPVRLVLLATILGILTWIAWRRALSEEEKAKVLGMIGSRGRWRSPSLPVAGFTTTEAAVSPVGSTR